MAYADPGSGYYAAMLAMMCVVVVLSGIGGSKGVVFGPVITDGGFFLFPLAYILGDVITEIYGIAAARRAIIAGFLANVLAVATYAIIIVLPGFTDDYGVAKQAALETALGPVWQIVLASALGFLAGQSMNSFIMWAGKKRRLEQGLLARLVGSWVNCSTQSSSAASPRPPSASRQWASGRTTPSSASSTRSPCSTR